MLRFASLSHGACAGLSLFFTTVWPLFSLPAANNELKSQVVETYADIVLASYEDSLLEAQVLQTNLKALVDDPSEATLESARKSWVLARIPYLQTEVYRFYSGPIDDEDGPEGLLNAWPMDEAYVDYVEGDSEAGIINDPDNYPEITKELIASLNEKDGEENISSGYHAIEFLLWGQDQSAEGPGKRPHTDYSEADHADRRAAYLLATTELLIENLKHLVAEWSKEGENYRQAFLAQDPNTSIQQILTGMSMLSGFELSGERLLVAMETQAQEDEHSCFSDTTHQDTIYDALGLLNVWQGRYARFGTTKVVEGPGIKELAQSIDADLAKQLGAKVEQAYALAQEIPPPFDQAILSEDGRAKIMKVVVALEDQADLLQKLSRELGFEVPISE